MNGTSPRIDGVIPTIVHPGGPNDVPWCAVRSPRTADGFPLLCAYPKVGFTQDASASMSEICAAHSKVLSH